MANSDFLWNEFRFFSNLIPYFRLFVNRTRVVEFFEIGDEICGFWRDIHNLQGGNFKCNLKITPFSLPLRCFADDNHYSVPRQIGLTQRHWVHTETQRVEDRINRIYRIVLAGGVPPRPPRPPAAKPQIKPMASMAVKNE